VSRDRGVRLQNALAAYLRQWWPSAESAGSGRPGSDVLGTPGIVWENKTPREFRPWEWTRQAQRHARARSSCCDAELGTPKDWSGPDMTGAWFCRACGHTCERVLDTAVCVYWPNSVGKRRPELALAILPLPDLVRLLAASEFEEA
jgi:hypothetical protein